MVTPLRCRPNYPDTTSGCEFVYVGEVLYKIAVFYLIRACHGLTMEVFSTVVVEISATVCAFLPIDDYADRSRRPHEAPSNDSSTHGCSLECFGHESPELSDNYTPVSTLDCPLSLNSTQRACTDAGVNTSVSASI